MALVITVREGEDFYIGTDQIFLTRIVAEDKIRVTRKRDGVAFEIVPREKTEIDEDVLVQLGDRMTTKAARLSIDAPRSKIICTGEKYRNPPAHMRGAD